MKRAILTAMVLAISVIFVGTVIAVEQKGPAAAAPTLQVVWRSTTA